VALTAFAAERRAAAWLMLTPAVQQSINICWPVGPQQQTRSNSVLQPDGTDRRTPDRCLDPAVLTMRAVPIIFVGISPPPKPA